MKRAISILLGLICMSTAHADRLYSDGFEPPALPPLFPPIGQTYQLPSGPTSDQLAWLLGELASGQNTSTSEVSAHFIAGFDPATTANFINNTLRPQFINAIIRDVVTVTPVRAVVVISSPGASTPYGYVSIGAQYTGSRKIVVFSVSNYNGSVQYPADQSLSLSQAADKFTTLSDTPALLIGRINSSNQCVATVDRGADQLRATGSIFKTWVLGAAGRAVADGSLDPETTINLSASKLALAGTINSEPLGTPFPLQDMAELMMGISDNT
ncbi:MAG: serine hydrolase, partial [Gammaproteobacteria bacterium]|nr:serine hydrolase [Gammaproteobacteria bacterium]